jgi:predicted aldo/keto reductase-like oxidoreductase/NAD-dependent dihydropyrimidine dehydrogenase PreA subunit
MDKIELGKTGLYVSPIGFGVLTIGDNQLNLPLAEGAALVRYGMDLGINFLDTAQCYRTYPYIKEALKSSNHDPVISSKSLVYSSQDMAMAIEEARKEMNRDVVDIFLLHEVRNDPDFSNRAGAWEQLQTAKAKGLVKKIGVSTHHVDVAQMMTSHPECDILFPLINMESLGIRHGSGFGTKEDMAAAIKENSKLGKGIFAMKAFGGGNLVKKYRECLDYVRCLPGIDSMMLGFGKPDEVDRAVEYAEGRLSETYSPDVSNKKICIDPGDCEGCGSCLLRCPNHAITINSNGIAEINAEICLTCGYCAPVCPTRAIILC